jgi:hypothetical protein
MHEYVVTIYQVGIGCLISREQSYIQHWLGLIAPITWPRGLTHEHSSPARTLGSWIRIPLEAWMTVCVCVRSILCAGSCLATG